MLRLLNVARPLEASTGFVPDKVPLFGLVPIARVMLFEALVTRLPPASRTSTWTAGVIVAPATVLDGCTRNASFAAGPKVMVNELDVAPESPVAAAVRV